MTSVLKRALATQKASDLLAAVPGSPAKVCDQCGCPVVWADVTVGLELRCGHCQPPESWHGVASYLAVQEGERLVWCDRLEVVG